MAKSTLAWWKKEGSGVDPALWPYYDDFRNFLALVWDHLNLPEPTPVQYDMALWLQRGPRRMIMEAFRGVGKSWITSAFVVWLLLRDPQLNIMVVSASKARSDDFSTFTLRLIYEMPILAHLRPDKDDGQRSSKISFDVGPALADQAPSVKSVGITGMITGSRADVIIADDIEAPNNSQTQGQRDKLAELVKEFDAVLKPGGRIIYLGTPQTEMSLYNRLPERGYEIRIWPARYPRQDKLALYGTRLAPMVSKALTMNPGLEWQPVDLRRFDEMDLLEREASYGRSGFALQFMLDTSLSDANLYPLKLSDLCVMNLNPDVAPQKVVWATGPDQIIDDLPNVGFNGDRYYRPMQVQGGDWLPYTGTVMTVDPHGRGKDETSYAVVKMLHGQLFLLDAGGYTGKGYGQDVLRALAVTAARYSVNHVIVESNFGDGMFTELWKPVLSKVHPCQVEEVHHSTQKEKRIIDTLEPVLTSHRLIVDEGLIRRDFESTQGLPTEEAVQYQLFYQFSRITRDRGALMHDDRLDALAMAVAYWVEQMAADVDAQVLEQKNVKLQEELDRFLEHAIGGSKPRGGEWLPQN